MRYVGRITGWNDAKGFGFVAPNGGGDRAFVHVKAFERHGRRPVDGDLISYVLQPNARGRRPTSHPHGADRRHACRTRPRRAAGTCSREHHQVDRRTRRPGQALAGLFNTLLDFTGQLTALLGPSGCGKTTTLRAISGLLPVRRGRIELGLSEWPVTRDVGYFCIGPDKGGHFITQCFS